jgi:hypothetical protein
LDGEKPLLVVLHCAKMRERGFGGYFIAAHGIVTT